MRSMWIAGLAIALTMTMVAVAQKQPEAAPAKVTEEKALDDNAATEKNQALEQLLAKALQNSPEIQVAEAKLKEAEALLRQTRLQIVHKAVDLHRSVNQKQGSLAAVEKLYKDLVISKSMSKVDLAPYEQRLAAHKAEIANMEASLNALTGQLPVKFDPNMSRVELPLPFQRFRPLQLGNIDVGVGGGGDPTHKRHPPQATAERLRKLLNTPFKIPESSGQVPLRDVIAMIRKVSGAPVLTRDGADVAITIDFNGEVTLGAYFQILCDSTPNLQIYVRDYGFLATTEQPPDDALPFIDFLHGAGGA